MYVIILFDDDTIVLFTFFIMSLISLFDLNTLTNEVRSNYQHPRQSSEVRFQQRIKQPCYKSTNNLF